MLSRTFSSPLNLRILIASIDYDDCIFISTPNGQSFLAIDMLKKHLIEHIRANQYHQVILMVGSSRQMPETAKVSFIALEQLRILIANETQVSCSLDKSLMSDVYRNIFQLRDEFKCAIKYLQMHKKASQYKDAEIYYHFYDNEESILKFLYSLYSSEKELMPYNLTSSLYQYDGNTVNFLYSISGCGIIDSQFIDNIDFMIKCAGANRFRVDVCNILDDDCLLQFKAGRNLSPENICLELFNAIQFIENNRTLRYKKEDYDHFVNALYILHAEIKKDIDQMIMHNQEEILVSNTIKMAKETYYMLLQFKGKLCSEAMQFTDTKNVMLHYGDNCLPSHPLLTVIITALIMSSGFLLTQSSNTIAMIWSNLYKELSQLSGSKKVIAPCILGLGVSILIKQSVNYSFFKPNEITKQVNAIKTSLNQFANEDMLLRVQSSQVKSRGIHTC